MNLRPIKIIFAESTPHATDVALVSVSNAKETEVVKLSTGQKSINIGVGELEKMNRRKLVTLFRKIISLAKASRVKKIAVRFQDFDFPNVDDSKRDIAEIMAINFEMANFEFVKYKTKPEDGWSFLEEVTVVIGFHDRQIQEGVRVGQIIGQGVNATRDLANTPGGEMTPALLAQSARMAAKGTGLKVSVLGKKEISKLKMGGILGVAQGSAEEPKFIILEHLAGTPGDRPVVLIGKGVTFDTGGLNLKPSDYIYTMHMDMSGGAAVIHTLVLAAKLGIKKNVIGLIPAVENMPSGSSYRPGDVLRTMNGKTIEVLNTDAEGRIILADALEYSKRYKPQLVIDVATLAGAAEVALGRHASAILTEDPHLEKMIREIGEESGDYVWPLPLWEEYESEIKGTFGDFTNTNNGKGKGGGTITAAAFLWQFIKGFPWIHIDIVPRMIAIESDYLSKGAAGAPVRLLVKLLERV